MGNDAIDFFVALVTAAVDAVEEKEEAAEEDGDRSDTQYPIKRSCVFHRVQ